jgi:hypothetical protein
MQAMTKGNFDAFRGTTGAVGEFPSTFEMTGPNVTADAWSVLIDISQSPTPPQWNAIVAY